MRLVSPLFFFREIYRLHGLPSSIVSDQDTRYLSHLWRSLWKLLGTSLDMSSAYHSQSDGQKEVTNRSLGNLLRCLVVENNKTWDAKFCQAEFAHNQLGDVSFSCGLRHRSALSFGLYNTTRQHETPWRSSGFPSLIFSLCISKHNTIWSYLHQSTKRRLIQNKRLPLRDYNKLKSKKIGPVEVLLRINPNAYRVKLSDYLRTSDVFDGKNLSPFHGENPLPDS